MNIKDILLAGGLVQFSFKENKNDWVGSAKIYSLATQSCITAKIIVDVPCEEGHYKEISYDNIDDAIKLFEKLVFSNKNMWYKHHEALMELNDPDIELDDDEDFERYELKRLELVNNEKKDRGSN